MAKPRASARAEGWECKAIPFVSVLLEFRAFRSEALPDYKKQRREGRKDAPPEAGRPVLDGAPGQRGFDLALIKLVHTFILGLKGRI